MTDGKEKNENNDEGKEDDTGASLVEKTNTAAERLEKANEERKEILDREEDLYAKQKLGGNSDAGKESIPKKSEEDIKKEQASNFFKGTALGDAIDTE